MVDLCIPAMDGLSVATAYRSEAAAPAPILFMTATSLNVERRTELAPDAVLAKPFDLERLLALVAAVDGGRAPVAARWQGAPGAPRLGRATAARSPRAMVPNSR